MTHVRARAMGTDLHIVALGGPTDLAARAQEEVAALERRWSRFLPDSEVSAVNAHAGSPVVVSPETFDLFALACRGARQTAGAFDPLVLPNLLAAGYDRSFELLHADRQAPDSARVRMHGSIVLERAIPSVRVPAGAAFDPGGIGKGLAADLVVGWMLDHGARGAMVNIGGDLRVAGDAPPEGWTVAIEDPRGDGVLATVMPSDGGVATTSSVKRRWSMGGKSMHHVIDPRTGAPCTSEVLAVTVIASQAWRAEVVATAAFVAGRRALATIHEQGVTGLVVFDDGSSGLAPGFGRFAA